MSEPNVSCRQIHPEWVAPNGACGQCRQFGWNAERERLQASLRAAEKRAEDAEEKANACEQHAIEAEGEIGALRIELAETHDEWASEALKAADDLAAEKRLVKAMEASVDKVIAQRQRSEEALAASQALVRSLREALRGIAKMPPTRRPAITAVRMRRIADAALAESPAPPDPMYVCNKCGYVGPTSEHYGCNYQAAWAEPAQVAPEPEAPICCEGMGWNRRAGRNFPHTSDCTRGASPSSPEPAASKSEEPL